MGIPCPRPFQVKAIQHSAFNVASVTFVISKTSLRKTAIPIGVGLLHQGITIIVVPLIGLGAHMVNNASDFDCGIEAYRLDEHRALRDFSILKSHLLDVPMNRVVYLFASHQSLSSKSG
jgi:hypothetical protein